MSDPVDQMLNALRWTRACLLVCACGGSFVLGRSSALGGVPRAIAGAVVALAASVALYKVAALGGFSRQLQQFLRNAPRMEHER